MTSNGRLIKVSVANKGKERYLKDGFYGMLTATLFMHYSYP